MIVQCDQCSQRYRIREDQLPASGGKIRCTNCDNVFVVRPSDEDGGGAASAKEDTRSWKLRLSGLTYEFHTLESLQGWLLSRESLKGVKLARDGEPWKEMGDYPEVLTDPIRAKFFPSGYVPTSSDVAEEASSTPEKKDETEDDAGGGVGQLSGYHNAPRTGGGGGSAPKPRPKSPSSSSGSGGRSGGRSSGGGSSRRPSNRRPPRGGASTSPSFTSVSASSRFLLGLAGVVVLAGILHVTDVIDLGSVIPGLKEYKDELGDARKNQPTVQETQPVTKDPVTRPTRDVREPPPPVDPIEEKKNQLEQMRTVLKEKGYEAVKDDRVFSEKEIDEALATAEDEVKPLLESLKTEVIAAREIKLKEDRANFEKRLEGINALLEKKEKKEHRAAYFELKRLEKKWPNDIELTRSLLKATNKLRKREEERELKKKLKKLEAEAKNP